MSASRCSTSVSTPPPPLIVSLPDPPVIRSSPGLPVIESPPAPPTRIVFAIANGLPERTLPTPAPTIPSVVPAVDLFRAAIEMVPVPALVSVMTMRVRSASKPAVSRGEASVKRSKICASVKAADRST
jgi:hypothetical protein